MAMLGALTAALLVIVAMILLGEYTKTRGRVLLTCLVLATFCLSAIPPSSLLRRRRLQPVGWLGLVASGTGVVLVAAGIWVAPNSDAYWKTTAIAAILAAVTFHISWLLLMTPLGTFALMLSRVAMVTSALAALLSVVGIGGEVNPAGFWWVVVLLLFASAVASLVLPAANRRPKIHDEAEDRV